MQLMPLVIFWAIVTAFIVCGCILTRKPTKKPLRETLRPAVPDEHQPGCFALEEERGTNWKGSGGAARKPRASLYCLADHAIGA